jgi:hypothetical protein
VQEIETKSQTYIVSSAFAYFWNVFILQQRLICFEAGGMSSTVFKPLLTAFFASQPTKYRGLPRFFHYFCDKVTIESGSIEEQLFSYLRGQNCIYVDAADSQYAQDVFGQSRRVVGVVSSRLLKVLHYPSPPPTKPVIVDTALRMLCVPEAV